MLQFKKSCHYNSIIPLLVSDIIPKFTKHPTSNYGNITGGPLSIDGCQYQSPIPLNGNDKIFYFMDGFMKYSATSTSDIVRTTVSFIGFTKNITSYEDQGFYQCGITIHGFLSRTILSNTTDVQFSGLKMFSICRNELFPNNIIK